MNNSIWDLPIKEVVLQPENVRSTLEELNKNLINIGIGTSIEYGTIKGKSKLIYLQFGYRPKFNRPNLNTEMLALVRKHVTGFYRIVWEM